MLPDRSNTARDEGESTSDEAETARAQHCSNDTLVELDAEILVVERKAEHEHIEWRYLWLCRNATAYKVNC